MSYSLGSKARAGSINIFVYQVRIQDLCKGGPSRGSGKNCDLKMGGQGGGAGPPQHPLDPHLYMAVKLMICLMLGESL